MPVLTSVDPESATGKTKELLNAVQPRTGRIPNMVRLMANSPATLDAYLKFAVALLDAKLDKAISDLIAVAVAQASGSDYTLSAVHALGRNGGRGADDLAAARSAQAKNPKTAAALGFAAKLVDKRGHLSASDVNALRGAGFGDGEVAEIIAFVVLNIFRNYFNLIAAPEIDFPVVTTGALAG
jgi:alkylhydroperoxidase family enzyme